jgi:hypothetical protein
MNVSKSIIKSCIPTISNTLRYAPQSSVNDIPSDSDELLLSKIYISKKGKIGYNEPLQICIPKVSNERSRTYILNKFKKLNIGEIYRIIENPLRSDENSKRVILYIKWNKSELSEEIQKTLIGTKDHMNVVYEMPWYWQIYANHPQKW